MENEEILINEVVEPTPKPVIPYIYNYKPDTKEFTGIIEIAEKDVAKSNQVGYFVPLVHADATTVQPPEVEENQIQIYSKEVIEHKGVAPETEEEIITYEVIESWNIEADYRKNFYKVDENLTVYDINTIGEQTGYIVVDKATGDDIKANKDWYKIVDNEVVKKSKKEYEQEQYNRREAEFNKAFFNTSFGYIRRKVTMKDGSKKDFLGDLLLQIKAGLELGIDVKIFTYDAPSYDADVTDWKEYQHEVSATPQFVAECLQQTVKDFRKNENENSANTDL